MRRNSRCLSGILALALLVSVAGQVAQARPAALPPAVNDTTAADFLTAFWGWFAARLSTFGHAVSAQGRQGNGEWQKAGSNGDPNGGSSQSNCAPQPQWSGHP
jgi:hypothetical protein